MGIETIVSLIAEQGFPIMCVIALAYYVQAQVSAFQSQLTEINKQHREEILQMQDRHSADLAEVRKAIENNTEALKNLRIAGD